MSVNADTKPLVGSAYAEFRLVCLLASTLSALVCRLCNDRKAMTAGGSSNFYIPYQAADLVKKC